MSLNRSAENGSRADAAVVTDAAGSVHGKLRGLVKWAFERMPAALGQTTMAASLPVTLASNQSAVPVSPTALVAGTANIGDVDVLTLPALVAGTANIGDVDVLTVPAPLSTTGGGTEATALRVTVANNSTGLLPVSVASIPSHAVTNAGTFAIQDSQKIVDNAGFTDGTTPIQPAGLIFDEVAGTALTENDMGAARMDSKRAAVLVIEDATTRGQRAAVTAGNAVKVDGSAVTQPVSVASVPSHAVTNAGTFATQVDGAALTSLQLIDDAVFTDDAAFTPGTSKVLGVGMQADETSTDSVDEGDVGSPRITLDRKQIVTVQPHSAGGCSIYRSIDLDEGTLEVVKNSPGTLYGMWVTNTATTTRFIKFYDATSGTAGTGTPVITIGIPGNTSDDVAGAFGPAGVGIAFATGICFGAVTGVADADTGAPGTNDVIANVFYK